MSSIASKQNPHNWSFASTRDNFVSGAARPGNNIASEPRPPGKPVPQPSVTEGEVEEWASFMKSQQKVTRVLCLLTGSELLAYKEGGLLAFFNSHFDEVVAVSDLYVQGAGERVLSALEAAANAKEHIVVHCSAGQGRTGVVLALWLHKRYNMSLDDAVAEVASHAASSCGAVRRPTVDAVLRLLGEDSSSSSRGATGGGMRRAPPEGIPPKTARGAHTPRLPFSSDSYSSKISSSSSSSEETPRSSRPLPKTRIAFVQMGGTIDKEYPQSTKGYAFEIAGGCPGARRVMQDAQHVPLGFHAEYHEVCRKDSTELTDSDRAKLASFIATQVLTDRIIVTHGSDTMIETAEFLSRDPRMSERTIVLTGSMRPQKFRDTDASFNIGVAVGSVHVLSPGVYIAMCGIVISHERCRRDMKTGAFVAVP